MKKVGFIIPQLGGGGAEKVIVDIVTNIQNDCDVTLITYTTGDVYENTLIQSNNIKYLPLDIMHKNTISKALTIRKYIKEYKFETFVSFLWYSNIVAYLATIGLKNKPKLILSERSNPIYYLSNSIKHKVWKTLLKRAYKNCSTLVPNSIEMGKNLKTFLDLKEDNIHVIQNSVDTDYIDSYLRNNPGYKPPLDNFILSVGRLHRVKNHSELINAFSDYLKENPSTKLNLIIAGEGGLRSQLLKQIQHLNLENRIQLIGFVSPPYTLMKHCKGYIQNSLYEGFPNSLLEALYINGSVASSNCPTGPNEMITSGHNGILFETNNRKELVSAIKTLDTNIDFINKVKKENQNTIKSKFGLENMIQKYKTIILSS